ncbi:hypothetical protein MJ575_23350 [Klebsiella pneumoniae]|nr:hypothetical protein MJ575_23350 [Klebsiella pneumoniae]
MGNAIQIYRARQYPDVLVEQRAISNSRVQIEIQIHDTGIGIPGTTSPGYSRPSVRPMPVFHAATAAPNSGW